MSVLRHYASFDFTPLRSGRTEGVAAASHAALAPFRRCRGRISCGQQPAREDRAATTTRGRRRRHEMAPLHMQKMRMPPHPTLSLQGRGTEARIVNVQPLSVGLALRLRSGQASRNPTVWRVVGLRPSTGSGLTRPTGLATSAQVYTYWCRGSGPATANGEARYP